MDFRSLLQSLDTLNEADVKHKGTYGTSHGKEDVRDQYGHRIGKVNKDADTKKDAPKKGRGRPKKGSDDSGEVKSYDTKSLHNVFGGGKKPSKEVGKTSKKHSLKEYIEEVATTKQLDEDNQFRTQPVPQQNKQMQMVTGPDGKPVLDQPVPTDTALRVANALNVSDVSEEMDEGSIQGGVWTATPPKPGQPNVPAPSGDPEGVPSSKVIRPTTTTKTPSPSISQPMGTIKGGVWTADPPKAGEKGVPAPVPIDEESLDEKAVSKAQQRFFGMVHAMQKGKKVPGASKELKSVAKGIGKKDAEDFASTKHKGLPQHVKKTNEAEVEESGLQAYLGNKKYGKEGMDKLRQAGREHASKEKMANIRAKYDKMDESQNTKKKVSESIVMEGAMKELLIDFHHAVHSHMGDGSMFDLKRATNVQQAEEVLKALVKHSDEYNHLDEVNQNELVNQVLKHLAHEKELPFNTFANVDKQRFAQRTPHDLSKFRQHPGATPGSSFSQPGSPMAVPRATTGSNGFLKTLSTPTLKESNDMKDKQFESWERELNSLLNEGITVSHSTGQQGSPDSLSINATEHDASELMSILRNSGMEMFGGSKDNVGGYGSPEQSQEPEGHGTEPESGPDVIGHGDDMLALIKKMSGIETDKNTPASVEVDYKDEEDSGEEGHDSDEEETNENLVVVPNPAGASSAEQAKEIGAKYPQKDGKDVDMLTGKTVGNENLEVFANPAGASSAERAKQIGAQFPQQGGKEPNLAYKIGEGDMEEGNAFTGKLAQTKQGDSFKMGDKTYKDTSSIEEDEMEEGNKFTGNLAKARAQGKKEADLDGDGDMEKVREGEDTCNECGMYESECGCEHVEEGYANDAGGDAMGQTELMKLKELLSHGNDLHRQKHSQATGNIQKVTMETTLLKNSTDLLVDYKKLSGIK